jgi:hypothetical protein
VAGFFMLSRFLNPGNSIGYRIATTGQGALSKMYWAVDPNTSLPTLEVFLIPIKIISMSLSLAN